MVADWVFKSESPTLMLIGGSVLVCIGFVSVNLSGTPEPEPKPAVSPPVQHTATPAYSQLEIR